MDFVCGFMREALSNRVVMVRKTKPSFQAGLLNGVGGKVDHEIETGFYLPEKIRPKAAKDGWERRLETPLEAMVREFKEETGIETTKDEWRLVLYMQDPRDFYTEDSGLAVNIDPGTVYWFACTRRFLPKLPSRVLDSGEELLTPNMFDVLRRRDCLATVHWVLPMAFLDPTLAVIGSDDHVLQRAQIAMAAPAVPLVNPYLSGAVAEPSYNGICKGDIVINQFGTERGTVHAFGDDGKVVWVNSTDYPNKWVTMYVEGLTKVGVSGATGPVGPRYYYDRCGPTGPTGNPGICGASMPSKMERDGVVSDGTGCAAEFVHGPDTPHWKYARPGAVGYKTGFPEPVEAPDAPWVKAQNDFGGHLVADKFDFHRLV